MSVLHFRTRRTIAIFATAIAILTTYGIAWLESGRLGHASYFTGITCLCCLLLLMVYGMRRRIPVLPLGNASTWTQIHIYTGLFATAVYVMHVPALIGSGIFECGLSLVFWMVSASGFYGIYASRTVPKRLTSVEGQYRFDQIPFHRVQLSDTAAGLLENVRQQSTLRVLGAYYTTYLKPFFDHRPSLAYVLVPSGNRRRNLLSGLKELDRYLEEEGRTTAGRFAALVRRRDDLDYQFALQLRLRLWLVIHAALSVALVVGAVVHALVAWRFTT